MSKPQTSLTKTCISCGLQKPLSAFLQLAGTQGTTYGNICASCRKSHADKLNSPKESEESTTSTTGAKIDAKAKVKGESDKREARKQTQEEYFEDREKEHETLTKTTEKTQNIARDEKKHRDSFLKKGSFLDTLNKPYTGSTQVFGGEDHKKKAGQVDLATGPVEITGVTGLIKLTQSPIFQAFKSWLGNAPIVSATEKAANQQNKTSPENKELDSLNDYAKNFGPRKK